MAKIKTSKAPSLRFLFSHPAHLVACGFGSGLSPFAPGTAGTLLAWATYPLLRNGMADFELLAFLLVWHVVTTTSLFGDVKTMQFFFSTPVAVLTPYLYTQIAFGALGGWLVFAHVPDAWSLAGIGLIAACGVFGCPVADLQPVA